MQAYSEVVKRHPEAWKTALPSRLPKGISALIGEFSPFPSSQARQNPRTPPFYAFLSSLSIGEYTDLLPSYFFGTRTSTPLVISLVSYECISMLASGLYFRFVIRERGRALSRGLFNPVGLVALALAFKRPFPSTSSGLSPTFNPPIPSPSSGLSHTIPHHPDQMTLQSYCATFFRPHRHPSDRTDRTDHTRDDSDDGCDDARYTADGCDDARYTADAANARDLTDAADACCLADATDDACCLADARTT
ncbi:hypothetical protein EV121DRAFT_297875 [Schizophyllum commune]